MINLPDIRYARLGTQDLDSSIRFATEIVGLQLAAREGNAAYFRSDKAETRGDTRDHTLVYFEGDPADQTIGLELIDPDDLDTVAAALEKAGRPAHPGTRAECDTRPTSRHHQFLPRPPVQHRHQTRHRILDAPGQRPRLRLAR